MDMNPDVLCARLAQRQFGVFSAQQASAAGLTNSSLYRRVSSGQLQKVLPGVFRISGVEGSFDTRAFAALLWAGDGSALSHHTAGCLWGFDDFQNDKIYVLCVTHRRPPAPWLIARRGSLLTRERVQLGRFFVTSVARTLLDLAASTTEAGLEIALESALRRRTTSVEKLLNFLQERGTSGRAGASRLRSLLLERRYEYRTTDSALEVKVQRLLRRSGIGGFETRPLLRLADGSSAEPDIFFRPSA